MSQQERISAAELRRRGGLAALMSENRAEGRGESEKRARGEIPSLREGMNKTEAKYADYLDTLIIGGEVVRWEYESIKLRLARKTFYTPDFFVLKSDGLVEFHETKGFMRDDAAVKIKVAAEKFPFFTFRLVYLKAGEWDIREIKR